MRNRATILFFVSFLLAGYCCQFGRFQPPVQQYIATLSSKKKTVALPSGKGNKYYFAKKNTKHNIDKTFFLSAAGVILPAHLFENNSSFYFVPKHFSSSIITPENRGPPSLS